MKIEINKDNIIEIKEVFNPIVLKTEYGEEISICMRDSGFEFKYKEKHYYAKKGLLNEFDKSITNYDEINECPNENIK